MSHPVTISVDAMSGDRGPAVVYRAAVNMLHQHESLRILLVGDARQLAGLVADGSSGDRLEIVPASQVVAMDEPPSDALRKKKQSSMRIAIDLLKEGRAQACVSAGNTGALMAIARFVLKTLEGVKRPAIISAIPAIGGHTHMLDLGANADCTPQQLFQFAVMGSVVAADIHAIDAPAIGLLNIGEEEIKGTDTIREAGRLLAASELNYIGFVEGDDIFSGHVDVVVTDGFTGNVALKTMEGSAHMLSTLIRAEFGRTFLSRVAAFTVRPMLRSLRAKLDPRRYNGASLVGLRGIVIKSHGGADEIALTNAIHTAIREVEHGVPEKIGRLLERQGPISQAV